MTGFDGIHEGLDLLGCGFAERIDLQLLLLPGRSRRFCLPFLAAGDKYAAVVVRLGESLAPQESNADITPFGQKLGRLKAEPKVAGIVVHGDIVIRDVADVGANLTPGAGVDLFRM